jgi:hypothetical protein
VATLRLPEVDEARALCGVSVNRPTPASAAAHPLHASLSGFSQADDDVLADFERGDDATVEPGPPRPSLGRPFDDPHDEEPFTPPVPAAPVEQLGDGLRNPAVVDRLRAVPFRLPEAPRPSPKVLLPLVAL